MNDLTELEIEQVILVALLFISAVLEFFFEKKNTNGRMKLGPKIWLLVVIVIGFLTIDVTYKTIAASNRERMEVKKFQKKLGNSLKDVKNTGDTLKIKIDTVFVIVQDVNKKADSLINYNTITESQKKINYNRRILITADRIFAATNRLNFRTPSTIKEDALYEQMSDLVRYLVQLNVSEFDNPVLYKYPILAAAWKKHLENLIKYQWMCDGHDKEKQDVQDVRSLIMNNHVIYHALRNSTETGFVKGPWILELINRDAGLPPIEK